MWRYQKPGFQALLLAELQRQQQGRQFCDTLLKTEGVSVPAHSCILSAISPHIASALSSAPPLLAGQSRLLEFRALRACTLLNVVRLVYSGEMAGEGGEEEKQQAISAAAELGIHGLVEVTKERDGEGRREEGRRTGMSAQTEAPVPGRNEGQEGRWTREVTNGSVFLWKETSSSGKKDTWTQTEELQVASAPPSHTAASFETIDMAAFQGLRPGDSHLALPQVPYVPLSLIYLPEENQIHPPPPQTFDPYSSHVATGPVDLQSLWADPQGAALDLDVTAAKEREVKWLEQFQGDIPGYISYYLNPEEEEEEEDGFVGGRARRRRGAGQGGARRAGTGERRDRRPRAKAGGRGRFPQRVDVQEVGASRLHKVFLQRSRSSRAGQGGGAVGRKLDLKTRELLRLAKTRKGRGKVWEFSQSGDVLTNSECGGGGGGGRGGRSRGGNTQQFNQDGLPVARARRARAKPAASVSFSSPSPSPAASTRPPSLCLPPLPLPPQEEQPEHLGRLLEEAMVGLDILPISHSAPHCRPPPPAVGGGYATRGNTLVPKKECRRAPRRGLRRSTRVAAKAGGGATSNGELPVLQQQGEGELSEVLENLLQTFEQHVNSCTARAAEEAGGESCQATPPKNTEEAQVIKAPPKKRRRGKKNEYPFSLERKTPRKPAASSGAMAADAAAAARRDEQLRQMPVVKLERSGPLPDRVALPKRSCPEVKSRTKAKAGSPSVKYERHSLVMEPYLIRSRLAGARVAEPCRISRGPPEAKPHCCPDKAEDGSTREQTETPDVDGVPEDDRCRGGKAPTHLVKEAPSVSPRVGSAQEESVRPAGGWEEDEDIDVIGTSVPIPEPVLISWSSGGEEEDGDEDIEVV